MTCPNCQHANPPGSSFCLGCGARLALACPSCGTGLPAGSKFCNKCGTPVTAGRNAPARLTSPEAYTPKHLAEKILTSRAALEGERKQVTVLFADLKGSMELLADRDPEEARKLLDPVLERMMEAVHLYEGTVNQVMATGSWRCSARRSPTRIMPCARATPRYACRTRWAIRRRARAPTASCRSGWGSTPARCVVRAIGSDLHMDYTAVGQTTHLAARMEQLAAPGANLLTDT